MICGKSPITFCENSQVGWLYVEGGYPSLEANVLEMG